MLKGQGRLYLSDIELKAQGLCRLWKLEMCLTEGHLNTLKKTDVVGT